MFRDLVFRRVGVAARSECVLCMGRWCYVVLVCAVRLCYKDVGAQTHQSSTFQRTKQTNKQKNPEKLGLYKHKIQTSKCWLKRNHSMLQKRHF